VSACSAERPPASRAKDDKGTDRCNAAFEALHVLAIDDVGTKVDAARVRDMLGEPSWQLETSPANYQWGYKLDPVVTDLALVKLVQHQLVDVLLGQRRARDPGQKNVGRYMRLPFGTNGKAAYAPGGFRPSSRHRAGSARLSWTRTCCSSSTRHGANCRRTLGTPGHVPGPGHRPGHLAPASMTPTPRSCPRPTSRDRCSRTR
jgi:hypothetical protein